MHFAVDLQTNLQINTDYGLIKKTSLSHAFKVNEYVLCQFFFTNNNITVL